MTASATGGPAYSNGAATFWRRNPRHRPVGAAARTSFRSARVLRTISAATSRYPGVRPRRALVLRCRPIDVAWLGGSV